MTRYEYKVVPAPRRARRRKGVRDRAQLFARTVQDVLSAEAVDGWEFLRAENLPCEERRGWFRRLEETVQAVLVFRRALPEPPAARPEARSDAPARAAEPVLSAREREAAAQLRAAARRDAPEPPFSSGQGPAR
ncbi:DUF4177 domain-containing protein [Oceanicella actignis]|uniref:DUF4177 domain-containing protein n=1 Tax=Oceanicella actignis TaxID=1189325 RepID=UPI0011E6B412|nr:DUF4177 domain-containing protein [Oceanicella actignis]TYO91278.1 hypothetical protein LY05_00129 [Oceanicella actignis]